MSAKKSSESKPCMEKGHCPPEPSSKPHQAMPPPLKRSAPPEAERRAVEEAVNGWWWL